MLPRKDVPPKLANTTNSAHSTVQRLMVKYFNAYLFIYSTMKIPYSLFAMYLQQHFIFITFDRIDLAIWRISHKSTWIVPIFGAASTDFTLQVNIANDSVLHIKCSIRTKHDILIWMIMIICIVLCDSWRHLTPASLWFCQFKNRIFRKLDLFTICLYNLQLQNL